MLDAFGRLRVVNNRSAMALTREIAAYWEGDVASTAAHLRVALHALWIHVIPTLRPWGSLKQLVAALQGRLLYIICSQLQLDRPSLIEKLKNAGDLELVIFLHDILPSLFPNFFTDEDARLYRQRMENAAHLAGAIVVNSHATAESFNSRFGKRLATGTLVVAPLGVSQPANIEPPPAPRQQPCFVMLGTIEPRKNHRLILDLWLKLYGDLGPSTPHLLFVGERGWKNQDVIELL